MGVHTLGYAQLRMMDNQNIDDGIGIAAHSSLTRSARWVVQDWQGPPWCQLYRLVSFSFYCLWPPPPWSKGQHLHSRKQEEEETRETEREVPSECIIFLFISHWQELSYMVIPSCKGLWEM